MKTLYESIIQSRFGDHKIEESILDIDAPQRLENDVKTGIKRQKLIQEILKPVEDIIKMYHFSTHGSRTDSQDAFGMKGGVTWYGLTSEATTLQDKTGVSHLQNILKKAYDKYKHENVYNSNSSSNPSTRFTFKDLGITIYIFTFSAKKHKKVYLLIGHMKDDKQSDKYVKELTNI